MVVGGIGVLIVDVVGFQNVAVGKPINSPIAFVVPPLSVQLISVCVIESPFSVFEFSNAVNNFCFKAFSRFSDVFVSILIFDSGLFSLDCLSQRVGSYEQ